MTLPADVDRPESQEVLVSNEVCLQFGIQCLWSRDCPLLALAALACLSLAGDGPVRSRLALLIPLFCGCAWQWLGLLAGSQDSYPTVWVAVKLGPSDCPLGIQAWSLS